MSLNAKQRRFAEEYSVDHNATKAAVRAGYSEKAAKQQGHRLLQNPAVRHAVGSLDAEKSEALGLGAQEVMARIIEDWDDARQRVPKIWKGEPVTWINPETGETKIVNEFNSPAVMSKAAELAFRRTGFDVSRAEVEEEREVVYTLVVDRDLREDA